MDPATFTSNAPGRCISATDALGRSGTAFLPAFLPAYVGGENLELRLLLSEADRELARLDGLAQQLEHPELLVRNYLRREAVLSSAIEGTHTSLADLVLFEATGAERAQDERVVDQYLRAHDFGWSRATEIGVGRALFAELHAILMDGTDRRQTRPGEFRDCIVFIGRPNFAEARFVPPPDLFVNDLLDNLQTYLRDELEVPLIKLAIAHYQFETIHPFRDGNGRVGRLMIPLWLRAQRILNAPMLYLSAFFERHRDEYYDRLLNVSQRGKWAEWITFFLRGVIEQSRDAQIRTLSLTRVRSEYKARLVAPRASHGPLRLVDELFVLPVLSVPGAMRILGVTYPAARASIEKLISANILSAPPINVRGTGYYFALDLLERLRAPSSPE